MTSHAPKLFALEALAAGVLSEPGRTRIERHLARCETCRAALTAVREYGRQRDLVRELPMPELSWERLERALEQDAAPRKQASRNGKLLALALPLAAIAATVVIGWIGISGQREAAQIAERQTKTSSEQARDQEEEKIAGWVTLGIHGAPDTSDVREGAVLRTGVGQELHVHLAADTGIVLGPESELVVTRLRAHTTRLTLVRGAVSSVVRKLSSAESYLVDAGDFSAEVRGTRFLVYRNEQGVRVDVHEGRVAILQHGKEIDLLTAGKSFVSGESVSYARFVDRTVVGLDALSQAWPTLRLPTLPQVTVWHVGDVRWTATAEMAMRAPAGDVDLSFEDARGKLHPLKVTLAAEGLRLEEGVIRTALLAEADARVGTLAPELITPVIQKGLPGLRRCYERGLRRVQVEGRLTLSVRVAADGHVARAQLRGESDLPADLTECIANQARGWMFPAPEGGPVAFEVPLNLKASSAP